VLTGLTTSTGGTVAAATTSLPERADTGRNYDYRFVWIRDQSYIGLAAAAAHADSLLDTSVSFVRDRLLEDGARLMPAYTAAGGRVPDERSLDLPGYPGGVDVIGNHVNKQFQLDVFGEALLLFAAADRAGRLDEMGWRAATEAAEAIERRWNEQDAGIWELSPRAWTHSRLQCVAGLRQMSARNPGHELAGRWITLADRIIADTTAHALHKSGRWRRAPDDDRIDAALLLPGIRGAVRVEDPRTVATVAAVEQDLTRDGYVYRFRQDQRPLGDAEGAFLLCGFLLALAKWMQGDRVAAVRWFDRNRTACGPPALLSEEYDVDQRQLRGNLPQAFVHALLLETAAVIGDVS
jgi:GH15 family glucan-1,4-alpha-glucosidase